MFSSKHKHLGTRWKWIVTFMLQCLYPQEQSLWYPLYRSLGGPQTGLEVVLKRRNAFPAAVVK